MAVAAFEGEALGAALPPLLVAALKVAATVAQGVHGRRRVGTGDSFWQVRPYRDGDELRSIDWRLTARGDRTYIREREWEAAQSVWLWLDPSASMLWRSGPAVPTKFDRAAVLGLALTSLLIRAGERIGLVGSDRHAQGGRLQLERLTEHLARQSKAGGTVPAPAGALPRHARIVLFGDFLAEEQELERLIVGFADQGLQGHLVHILDPAEVDFPYLGRTRFRGIEHDGELVVGRAETLAEAYRERLAAHRAALGQLARRSGWTVINHRTDHAPETALLALYRALSDEGPA